MSCSVFGCQTFTRLFWPENDLGGPFLEVDRLRLPYRSMLTEQGFTIVYAHISKLNLEAPTGPPVLREHAECPDCKGCGEVGQHGGLRKKACWRCAGRGWIKAPVGR